MTYNTHLANRARLRAITATPPAIPPLPVTSTVTPAETERPIESVLDNIVTLPTRPETPRHLVDIRTVDAGRLNWKPITDVLGWAPGDPLAVSWAGEWMVLSSADDDDYSRIEVDERGRKSIGAGPRVRLSETVTVRPGQRVTIRTRPDDRTQCQCGRAAAWSDTCPPRSSHSIKAKAFVIVFHRSRRNAVTPA